MNPKFRPILGIGIEKVLERGPIQFPVLATPKFDGIRCITSGLVPPPHETCVPLCRSLKPVPNGHIRTALARYLPPGLDGELMTYKFPHMGQPPVMKSFQEIQSDVMTRSGIPDFIYHIFDFLDFDHPEQGYADRIAFMRGQIMNNNIPAVGFVSPVFPVEINSMDELDTYEEKCLSEGYEGICYRLSQSKYKFGRSTAKEQCLVKVKRFETAEAVVIDMCEEMGNNNPTALNELGYAERSSHKAHMVGKGRMGALVCEPIGGGERFQIGTGFDADMRSNLWRNYKLGRWTPGLIVQYKHQPHGRKDKPRIPVFIGFRDPTDMDVKQSQKELPL